MFASEQVDYVWRALPPMYDGIIIYISIWYTTCFGRLCGVLVMKDAMGSEREVALRQAINTNLRYVDILTGLGVCV